jgi:hypothetical protein
MSSRGKKLKLERKFFTTSSDGIRYQREPIKPSLDDAITEARKQLESNPQAKEIYICQVIRRVVRQEVPMLIETVE